MPYYTPYVAAKFAVVGFSQALREELLGTGPEVVTVMPAAMDTPALAWPATRRRTA